MITNVVEAANAAPVLEISDDFEQKLLDVFKLLSEKHRLRILMYLQQEGELHVTALCEKLDQSQPAVSHHLALLKLAGLVKIRREGKHNFYSVQTSYFHKIMEQLFASITNSDSDEIRFSDFVLSHEN